jgi:hypothetical protein
MFQRLLDAAVAKARFSMTGTLTGALKLVRRDATLRRSHDAMISALGPRVARHVLLGILRAIFLIELVKQPKIETTKFETRWSRRLPTADPRHATYEVCFEMFRRVLSDLRPALATEANRETLTRFEACKLLAYEIPLDYRERRLSGTLHVPDNVTWLWDDVPRQVGRFRAILLNLPQPDRKLFGEVLDKIKVKTYLTDRVLTGPHKTNREKRWETHPQSVHYALRKTCLEIELALLRQLCGFQGFPEELLRQLTTAGAVDTPRELTRCPVTMDPLSFESLKQEMLDPQHGKANLQIAHLNPLKAVNRDPRQGHTAANISWASADGNRIQGHLSLDEVRALLRRIQANYDAVNLR